MNLAIALTLYRRPLYTKEVLDALLSCYGIEDVPVYISHDWNFEMYRACEEVARLAESFRQRHRGETEYFVHKPKLGIDLNKLFVIPKAFEAGADFVILIEDDTVPSPDLLRFMRAMAERYKDEKQIWSVCGYNNLTEAEFERASPNEYGFRAGMNPWTWGVWRDRWDEFYGDGGEQYKADTGNEANGLFDHWLSKKGRMFVLPVIPRCKLIGEFGAEHTTPQDWEREQNLYGTWNLVQPIADGIEYRPTSDLSMLHAGTAHIQQ